MTAEYSIDSTRRDGVEVFTLRQSEDVFAEVAPALGNNCFAFQAGAGVPVLEPVPFEAFRAKPTSYGIPILFPFPNRIRDGVFLFEGRRFPVEPNRHGYVRDKPWDVVEASADAAEGAWITSSFEAAAYPDAILAQFPFPFRLDVTYRLKDGTLAMETAVRNVGTAPMPFGFGIHPYFRRPESGTLQVPAARRWELEETLPTGKLVALEGAYDLRRPRDLDELSLDDIYTEIAAGPGGEARCVLADSSAGKATTVAFDTRQFPHVVLFTPPAPRRAICIEPYTCPTDAFNLQERGVQSNVIVLAPGEARDFVIRIEGAEKSD